MTKQSNNLQSLSCYHCGEICKDDSIKIDEKIFCCNGCKTVYELLEANNLCNYYSIESSPGITRKSDTKRNFDFLDDEQIIKKLVDFVDGNIATVTFFIPQIHCSSCIWILENLYKLDFGIKFSEVNFLKKTLSVRYAVKEISLKKLVELLDALGYLPLLNLDEKSPEKENRVIKKLYYKLGVAGFAFGNIMLLSFPDYLSLKDSVTENLKNIFAVINFFLALPVVLFSASEYYLSAIKGLQKKIFNVDVPISLGIFVLFLKSSYEIFFSNGTGYFDSLAGLVFFLLLGKLFQHKTYDSLNFERNYKSYFPISVTIRSEGKETTIPAEKISVGQRIFVHNNEILPADSVLISENCSVDYSFVTGESTPVQKVNGEIIYAGGKIIGTAAEVETIKEISQSYLTQLWNSKAFSKKFESNINNLVNIVSKYFSFAVLLIALVGFFFWISVDLARAYNSLIAVLIIACPCALALSTPFTLGNTLRIFGRNKFYIKNVDVIERLSKINHIVFDKTGTITEIGDADISFIGERLAENEICLIASLTKNSSHPFSKLIFKLLSCSELFHVEDYSEIPGKGLSGKINGKILLLGSSEFVGIDKKNFSDSNSFSSVFLSIDGKVRGFFSLKNKYRTGIETVAGNLSSNYKVSILSGDNDAEEINLRKLFPRSENILFNQTPFDKLNFIKSCQQKNELVLMIGDGLNDAGALSQSNVGISISENINNFSPACDGILDSKSFYLLNDFISFSKTSMKIIIISFVISFIYNIVGFSFALTGNLSPIIAAILMPVSSISVVVFTTAATSLKAKRMGLLKWK